ncbi:MAG: RNA methyltransferase RsmE [Planctomycetaceae bacterium]|nr:RNA methyltransferase RsmE [Planctomycetaceae bacterium]
MMHRFHAEDLQGDELLLRGREAHHLTDVLRQGPGTEVELFDGRGTRAVAEVISSGKRETVLTITARFPDPSTDGPELVLATAIPKGDRFRSLVEKTTELGIDRLIPLRTDRSVVHPGKGKCQKMNHAVIAACKQCGRNRLMAIEPVTAWREMLAIDNAALIIAHPGESPAAETLDQVLSDPPGSLVFCVGPEGGWSETELQAAGNAGAVRVSLGPHVLRIETAAIALAALVTSRL